MPNAFADRFSSGRALRFSINWQPNFLYRGLPARGETIATPVFTEDRFAPKLIGVTKYGTSPCEMGIGGVNTLLNLTKQVDGLDVQYVRFISKRFRRVRVKYLIHNSAFCLHPADVGIQGTPYEQREAKWLEFSDGLNNEEKQRAITGWQSLRFFFAVLPMRTDSYFTTLHLIGLRDYPPFNEVAKLITIWNSVKDAESHTKLDLHITLEEYRKRSKKVHFANGGVGLLNPTQEKLIVQHIQRIAPDNMDALFRRVDLEWFYEGIRKTSTTEETVVEKVGINDADRRIRPTAPLI